MSKPLKKSFIELPAAGESLENALQSSQLKGSNGGKDEEIETLL